MTRNTLTRRDAIRALGVVGVAGIAGCTGDDEGNGENTTQKETVRAAFVYNSEVGDLGWSWAHNEGRKAVVDQFDWVETAFSEAVAPADSERVFQQYTNDGFDIVFGNTFEYMDPMISVAESNPETLFEHCSGYETRENLGRYFGRMYQARYLAGIAAGMTSEENSLGYVAAFPIPEVVRGINAYTLGARSVNDQVSTKVRWTNTWFDPPTEREAAQSLIDEGVDVMAQHQDSPAAVRAAESAGIWSTGYDAPMREFGGDKYITSPIWHWDVFYAPTIQSVRNGEWTSDSYWEGLNAGIIDLSEWGPQVSDDVKSTVDEERSAIESGDLDIWAETQFAEEDDTFLFQEMSSYVEGVEGSVPS